MFSGNFNQFEQDISIFKSLKDKVTKFDRSFRLYCVKILCESVSLGPGLVWFDLDQRLCFSLCFSHCVLFMCLVL